jgi:phospholipid/cholesterol/gamma-HCH transport system substrate-binding protein
VESGPDLVNSLSLLPTFPFSDGSADAFAGDYANLYVKLDLDLSHVLENMARSGQPFPGPDGPLGMLPPTSQLLGPLLGPTDADPPDFPLLSEGGLLPLPDGETDPAPREEGSTPTPEPTRERGGGLLGGLLGGGE